MCISAEIDQQIQKYCSGIQQRQLYQRERERKREREGGRERVVNESPTGQ